MQLLTPLKTLIHDVMMRMNESDSTKSVTLNVSNIPENWATACRPHEISHVLYNLLTNAIDSASTTPEPWVQVDVREDDARFLIQISDSGRGIPSEWEARIWQPFFTTKDSTRCRGLGLSMARGIVERNGGELFLDRSLPHTCFTLTLTKSHPLTPQRRVS